MDLASVLTSAPAEERMECRIDVSDLLGNAADGGPITFVYREPDIPTLFIAAQAAKAIRIQNPEWTADFCESLAVMSLSHASPAIPSDRNVNVLYVAMAKERPKLYRRLLLAYRAAFPSLSQEAIDEKKGASAP